MRFLLYSTILLGLLLSNVWSSEHKFHVLDINENLSESVCESNTTDNGFMESQTRMDVFRSRGPCAAEFLPVHTSSPQNNSYVVPIGLGTPHKKLFLLLDTTSNLIWTQCKSCILSCFKQREPLFDPNSSTTYSALCCKSPECSLLNGESLWEPSCSPKGTCVYAVIYRGFSATVGYLGRDKLTLAGNKIFGSIVFGCSQFSDNLILGLDDGYLGLGRGNLSLVSQTDTQRFSICLPSKPSVKGYLKLEKGCGVNWKNRFNFTPLVNNPEANSSYFVKTVSIAVGGVKIEMSPEVFSGETKIDTVKIESELPPDAYDLFSQEFKRQMNNYGYKSTQNENEEKLDTCFIIPNKKKMQVPTVSFIFQKNVTVDIHVSGILMVINQTVRCLAFRAGDSAVLGNYQQKTLELGYDMAGGSLGFRHNGCA